MVLQEKRLTEGCDGQEGWQICLEIVTQTADTLHQNRFQLQIVQPKVFARDSVPTAFTDLFRAFVST